MFEVIDSLIGPLFRLNVVRYAFNSGYRAKLQASLGKEARYLFIYQVVFYCAASALLVSLILSIDWTAIAGPG